MTVVTLEELLPIPRYDGIPFTAADIYEGPTALGPWTLLGQQIITPVDPDPSDPQLRGFTVENAVEPDGWYYVVFRDATGDLMLPTVPMKDSEPPQLPGYLPTVQDVGALVHTRTRDNNGNELGTFTSVTRPTAKVTLKLIQKAASDITSLLDYDIPVEAWGQVSDLIAHAAAMRIELTLFPDQMRSGRSNYDELKTLHDEMLERVQAAVARESGEETLGESMRSAQTPRGNFPASENWLTRKM